MSVAPSPILVTGAAGFIGFHACKSLLEAGHTVIGVDCLNDYYDVKLKQDRLALLNKFPGFQFEPVDLADEKAVDPLFKTFRPSKVLHLAAQAGVRHSISNPYDYAKSNLLGFLCILEGCRRTNVEHLVYASSSSVYGAHTRHPYSEHEPATHPVSLYAATKGSNELMAHSYSHLYRLPSTGLRFFTVYGPWGRPDMAYYSFTKAILEGRPIELFNQGQMKRDFTYIDDVIDGIVRLLNIPASPSPDWNGERPDPATSSAPFRIYNIGNNSPVTLDRFVSAIEAATGRSALRVMRDMQPGDVVATAADITDLAALTGFSPKTSIEDGMKAFVDWYRGYHGAGLP